jgi:CHAT domain-containing protein
VSDQKAAIAELGGLESLAESRKYLQLLGRVRWMQGLICGVRGELTDSLEQYRSARTAFHAMRDTESEAFILAAMAEDLQLLGETRGAWRERLKSLPLLTHVRSPRRRHGIFVDAVRACLYGRMPRSGLHFGNALVETALDWSRAAVISDAHMRRAGIYHLLGADKLAASDLLESRRWIDQISDETLATRQKAEVNAAEGEILVHEQPDEAARSLGEALAYFKVTAATRLPTLHLLLARAQMAHGLHDAAESELSAGIQAMERQRVSLRDAALQVSFFDQSFPLFDDMVRLQVENRRDPERALAFVERGHARQLVDSLAGAAVSPLDPETLRRELPAGLALIYYVSLDDRLFAWALSGETSHFIERPLPAAELSRLVAANSAAIEGRAPQQLVRRTAARLHDELVRPLIPFIASQRALVFIPDRVLQSVAFASLWNRQTGRYLVEDYMLGVAPSGTVFVRASTSVGARLGATPRVLVVGNPQLDRDLWASMPNLPGADAEAIEIAGLYARSELLTGREATRAAFLDGVRKSQIVHYAGHAASSADGPSSARLLLAQDPRTGDSGALYLHDLGGQRFPRTRVVVLAACRTAAGAVSSVEGALSLGRPFLAAGVPDVVGSLWDIDDSVSWHFFIAFHRALLTEGDPSLALRKAQLAFLRGDDVSLAHPASWAAFICMGGFDLHSFSKGEAS